MTTTITTRKIKAIARHHGLFITLLGLIALVIVLGFCFNYWHQARFVLMFMVLTCLVTISVSYTHLTLPTSDLV